MSDKHQPCLGKTLLVARCKICHFFPPLTRETHQLHLCKFLMEDALQLYAQSNPGLAEPSVQCPSPAVSAPSMSHALDLAVWDKPKLESWKLSHGHQSRSPSWAASKHSTPSPSHARLVDMSGVDPAAPPAKFPHSKRKAMKEDQMNPPCRLPTWDTPGSVHRPSHMHISIHWSLCLRAHLLFDLSHRRSPDPGMM